MKKLILIFALLVLSMGFAVPTGNALGKTKELDKNDSEDTSLISPINSEESELSNDFQVQPEEKNITEEEVEDSYDEPYSDENVTEATIEDQLPSDLIESDNTLPGDQKKYLEKASEEKVETVEPSEEVFITPEVEAEEKIKEPQKIETNKLEDGLDRAYTSTITDNDWDEAEENGADDDYYSDYGYYEEDDLEE